MENNGNKRRINFEEEQPLRLRRREFDQPGPSSQAAQQQQQQHQDRFNLHHPRAFRQVQILLLTFNFFSFFS